MARKTLSRDQAETAKNRAVSFLRNVLQDDVRADEVEGESVDDWAEETGRKITNPKDWRPKIMASGPTKVDLQDTLDQIGSIITDALDPALSREEVIDKLKEIDDLVNDDDDDVPDSAADEVDDPDDLESEDEEEDDSD